MNNKNAASSSNPAATKAQMMAAFDQFLAAMRRSAETALDRSSGQTPIDLATGLRHIASNMSLALAIRLYEADPLYPEFTTTENPHQKFGGDNPDALYLTAPLSSEHVYRVYGNRGSAKFISFVVQDRTEHFAGNFAGMLLGRDLKTDANGDFELFIGGSERPGNWMPLQQNADNLLVRQFFADWNAEKPMRIMIDRVGEAVPPPLMSAEKILAGLDRSARMLESMVTFWQDMMDIYRPQPNQFINFRTSTTTKMKNIAATPGGAVYVCHWEVPVDSALIIRVKPPQCEFWNLEFCNSWWETNDYRYRLTGTNMHHAVLEEDSELIVVISHDDPGLPNWFDTSGFAEGMMDLRWMEAGSAAPVPACTLVKRSELTQHLPQQVKKITDEERRAQLVDRRRGIYNRFNWM